MFGTFIILSGSNTAFANTETSNAHDIVREIGAVPSLDEVQLSYEAGNYTEALRLAEQRGHPDTGENDAEAQVIAGHILMRGKVGVIDMDGAARWFRLAAAQKHSDAMMALGEIALRGEANLKPSDALTWFSAASQTGRLDAKRAIGEMYLKGRGIKPDNDKARTWLQEAADRGDGQAARILADSYFDQDAKMALKWYSRAAELGGVDSAYIAAIMYAENLDVRPDANRMAELLRQAAEGGHAAAQADYGLLVYQGAGVPQSTEGAAKWFEKSAKGGDPEGQFLYAFTLAKGEGVEQSYEEAYFWLLKSGESDVKDYQKDRNTLRLRLEDNVDPNILARARERLKN